MFRVAFITTTRGVAVENVKSGFLERAHELFGDKIKVVDLSPFSIDGLHKQIKLLITEHEADLLVCMGNISAKVAYEVVEQRHRKIPIIITGLPSLEMANIPQGKHATGICIDPITNVLPAQLVLRILPHTKSILIPHRPDIFNGRIRHDAYRVKRYFEKRGVIVNLFALYEEKLPKQELLAAMEQSDLVLNIECGLFVREINDVSDLAKEAKIPFWADGEEATKQGAFCAVKNDFNSVGMSAAEYAHQILIEDCQPGDLPVKNISHSRSIEINKEQAFKCGVVLTEDIEISFDQAFDANKELGTMSALFVCRYPELHNRSIAGELGIRMNSDRDFVYQYDSLNAWRDDNPTDHGIMLHYFDQQMKHRDVVFVFEDVIAQQIYEHMKEKGIRVPIVVITNQYDAKQNNWYQTADRNGIQVIRFFIEPPRLAKQFEILQHLCPTITTINVPIFKEPKRDLTHSMRAHLRDLERLTTPLDIRLNLIYVNSFEECEGITVTPNSHWLLPEDNFDPECINMFCEKLNNAKAICVAGNIGIARRVVASIGNDYKQLTHKLLPLVKHMLETKLPPAHRRVELTMHEQPLLAINKGRCLELGRAYQSLFDLDYYLVSVDHSLDTMHAMHIMTYEEYMALQDIRDQKKKAQLKEPTRPD